jgi:hypothetical protein
MLQPFDGGAVSVLARRPLVGVTWQWLTSADDTRQVWHTNKAAVRAFDVATLAFVAVFAVRFVVQDWLCDSGSAGWLAFARIGDGLSAARSSARRDLLGGPPRTWSARRRHSRTQQELDPSRTSQAHDDPQPVTFCYINGWLNDVGGEQGIHVLHQPTSGNIESL